MDHFQQHLGPGLVDPGEQNKTDRLHVVGTIDTTTRDVALQPFLVLPDVGELEPPQEGDCAIVFRDGAGSELVRHAFTPDRMTDVDGLGISERVPYAEGTTEVVTEKTGAMLTKVTAGSTYPEVTITQLGERVRGDSLLVVWTARDADGDSLVHRLEYFDGKFWQPIALALADNEVAIDISGLPAEPENPLINPMARACYRTTPIPHRVRRIPGCKYLASRDYERANL